jgi:hypothetical protein
MINALMSLLTMLLARVAWSGATAESDADPSADVRLGWDPDG